MVLRERTLIRPQSCLSRFPHGTDQSYDISMFFDVPARKEGNDDTHDGILPSVEFSLEPLGVDSIDILFAHDLDIVAYGNREALDVKLYEFMADA